MTVEVHLDGGGHVELADTTVDDVLRAIEDGRTIRLASGLTAHFSADKVVYVIEWPA